MSGDKIFAAKDRTIKLWKTDGTELTKLKGRHNGDVHSVQYNYYTNLLLSAGAGTFKYNAGNIVMFDSSTGKAVHVLKNAHKKAVNSAQFNKYGTKIVSTGADKTIKIWSFERDVWTETCSRVLTAMDTVQDVDEEKAGDISRQSSYSPTSAYFSYNSKFVIMVVNGLIKVLDDNLKDVFSPTIYPSHGKGPEPLPHGGKPVKSAQFSPVSLDFVSWSVDNNVIVWESAKETESKKKTESKKLDETQATIDDLHSVEPATTDDLPDVEQATIDDFPDVEPATAEQLREASTEGKEWKIKARFQHEAEVNYASFSPDGSKVVSASEDKVRVWDVRKEDDCEHVLQHDNEVNYASFSPDGTQVVSTSSDAVRLWSLTGTDEPPLKIANSEGYSYAGFAVPYGKWRQIFNPSGSGDSIFVVSEDDIDPINYVETLSVHLTQGIDGATGEGNSMYRELDAIRGYRNNLPRGKLLTSPETEKSISQGAYDTMKAIADIYDGTVEKQNTEAPEAQEAQVAQEDPEDPEDLEAQKAREAQKAQED